MQLFKSTPRLIHISLATFASFRIYRLRSWISHTYVLVSRIIECDANQAQMVCRQIEMYLVLFFVLKCKINSFEMSNKKMLSFIPRLN